MSDSMMFENWVFSPDGVIVDILKQGITTEIRQKIAQNLKDWLASARVKPVADLEARRTRMNKRFDQLAETVMFSIGVEGVVVTVVGAGEDTLKALQNGTDWFDPCNNVVRVMISALWKS